MDEKFLKRYDRNIRLDGFGVSGQEKLFNSSFFVAGVGGLGSAVLLYLAAAGAGRITVIDSDRVEASNLARQAAHGTNDIGREKAFSAADAAFRINPGTVITPLSQRLTRANIGKIAAGFDFIIDAADNFSTKYLINEYCVKNKIPYCHAGVQGFSGQVMTYVPGSACLACVFGDEPAAGTYTEPAEEGVLGPAVGFAATMQAAEAVKYAAGAGEPLTNSFYSFDMKINSHKIIKARRREDCAVCGKGGKNG